MDKVELNEIFNLLPKERFSDEEKHYVRFKGYDININKRRLFNIRDNNATCKCCGLKGEYFVLEQNKQKETIANLILCGTKDGERVVISTVGEKAIRPKYKVGTVLCTDCMHKHISHNKSNGYRDWKNAYEEYKQTIPEDEDCPFKDLLKDSKIQ